MSFSVPLDEQQQFQYVSQKVRRRRRPKKRPTMNREYKSAITDDDEWYDTDYQILSGCVSPLEQDFHDPLHEKYKPPPLPILMYEREVHGQFGFRQVRKTLPWTSRMLFDRNKGAGARDGQNPWRPYCQQALKFSWLRTNIIDAVIGISSHGNYFVALEFSQCLTLNICGVPNSKEPLQSIAPLLLSIPLIGSTVVTDGDDTAYGWQYAPEQCPLRVWLSSDERVGVCMYRKLRCFNSAHVVLFPLPPIISTLEDGFLYYELNHVHVPPQAKQDLSPIDDHNLLIHVPFVPCREPSSKNQFWLCDQVMEGQDAYLSLIDEEDGYRLTWFQESSWKNMETCLQSVMQIWEPETIKVCDGIIFPHPQRRFAPYLVRSTPESRIVVQVADVDSGWEQKINEPTVGKSEQNSTVKCRQMTPQLTIVFTGFLSITSLLSDILTRRPALIWPVFSKEDLVLPTFTYHLDQVKGGRIVELLLVFSVGKIGCGCLGIFVSVDLLTQDYREMEWIRHQAHDTPPPSCAKLASDRHKRLTCDCIVETLNGNTMMETLYPDCVVMDNKAIRRQYPTTFMSARSAPVSLSFV
jgi:hypothetical protein